MSLSGTNRETVNKYVGKSNKRSRYRVSEYRRVEKDKDRKGDRYKATLPADVQEG